MGWYFGQQISKLNEMWFARNDPTFLIVLFLPALLSISGFSIFCEARKKSTNFLRNFKHMFCQSKK